VLYHVRGVPGRDDPPVELNEKNLRDIAASFQAACIDTIITKLKRALKLTHAKSLIVGGGVSANRGLRGALSLIGVPVFLPAMQYCTDNAAMTAGLAHLILSNGKESDLDLDAITYSQFRA
jgi:N6-L-threonylcarbamoyladenine synthase